MTTNKYILDWVKEMAEMKSSVPRHARPAK